MTQFKKIRSRLLVGSVEKVKPFYAAVFKRQVKPWQVNIEQLRGCTKDSLGFALATFLDSNNFRLEPYFENHDVYHVVLGFTNTAEDEALMQFWLLGNGKTTFFTLMTTLLCLLILPELIPQFIQQYRQGKSCFPVQQLDYENLLDCPLSEIRQVITLPAVLTAKKLCN